MIFLVRPLGPVHAFVLMLSCVALKSVIYQSLYLYHPVMHREANPLTLIIQFVTVQIMDHKKPGVKKFSCCVPMTFDSCYHTLGP